MIKIIRKFKYRGICEKCVIEISREKEDLIKNQTGVNEFEDFSASYDELTSTDKKFGDNTEVVLFRNSYESSLKPSYVMYIGNDKLDSVVEKENLELVRKQMKEAGLDVPLVIFDRFSIKEKMKDDKLEQKQNYDEVR